MAKYPYIVNKNGVWYASGSEVPEDSKTGNNKKTEESNKNDFSIDGKAVGKVKEDVIEITNEEVIKENQFTKTEINRMSTAELKEVAKLNGVKDADDMTGGELKKVLIDKFEL